MDNHPQYTKLSFSVKRLRCTLLPRYTYEHAGILRETLGERMPLSSIEDDGVAIMWKTAPEEPPRVWVGPVSGIKRGSLPRITQ
jgi:hypothetical protein